MKDNLIGIDANGQTIVIFRKNGLAIYGRWVNGQYQTEIMRAGIPPRVSAPALPPKRFYVKDGLCPLCSAPMIVQSGTHPHRRSRDHILPLRDGHKAHIYGDTRNIRIVCQECNGLLNRLGQCPGAVACWIAVSRRDWQTTAV